MADRLPMLFLAHRFRVTRQVFHITIIDLLSRLAIFEKKQEGLVLSVLPGM